LISAQDRPDAVSRRVDVADILRVMAEAGGRICHIAGFAVVVEPQVPAGVLAQRAASTCMLTAFIGPYGMQVTRGHADGITWASVLPESDQVFSTWSQYGDQRGVCLIEGDFYSDAWGYRPAIGLDRDLARLVMDHVLERGPDQIDFLNGMFSGLVFSHSQRRIWLFVDRLGARFLYYRAVRNRCEVATNIYGFRRADPSPRVDAQALNEHLVLGSPTSSKTLFEGIALVPPGKVVEWSEKGVREYRYYRYPTRRRRQSLIEGAEMVCAALDSHVRGLRLPREECSIALSAGKDSRVVLGGLLRSGLRPRASIFTSGGDVKNALRICQVAGLSAHVVSERTALNPVAFDWDSALLLDGYQAESSFLAIAADAGLQTGVLFTGFAGDYLSGGGWGGLKPWKLASPEALAMREYQMRGAAVSPALLSKCLRHDLRVPQENILTAFVESVRSEYSDSNDLVTTYLLHRTSHRNRRRIASIFHSMRACTAVVHPFVDRCVLNAYLELPLESIMTQGTHYLAAMYELPALGRIPAGSSWLPLTQEFTVRRWLEGAKQLARGSRWLISATRRRSRPAPLSPRHRSHIRMALESNLFDAVALASSTDELAGNRRSIIKLGATALHVAWVMGHELPSAPGPTLLKRYAGPAREEVV
jgi:asparagine synthetase B (glutamine-hydrolysing)